MSDWIAALPMYDRPGTGPALDRLWVGLRDRLRAAGIDAPEALDRQTPIPEAWRSDRLLLGQICNLPYRTWFRGQDDRLTVLGCNDHRLEGAAPGQYYAVVITRPGMDPATAARRFAYNEGISHSGWGSPWVWSDSEGLQLTPMLETGAHAASIRAVLDGEADMAAIDAVSWAIIRREPGYAGELTVHGRTDASPGQSYITRHPKPGVIRDALRDTLAGMPKADRDALLVHGLVTHPDSAYEMPLPPDPKALAIS